MNAFLDNKTIIACSTGTQQNTAIGVIRLSGFINLCDLSFFFNIESLDLQPRRMYKTEIIDSDNIIDSVLICFFKGNKSYTGENLLEIYTHGNSLNIKKIIDLFCKIQSIRQALPGEFTYRAVQNKKMTVSQAEGLDLFLNATNGYMLKQGMSVLQGELHNKFIQLYEKFKFLKVNFELQIDFLEDIGESYAEKSLNKALNSFGILLQEIFERTKSDKSNLLTPKIILAGQTNVGKSTLFNKFLGENRSIVSSIKGTTRDYIGEHIKIKNNMFQLIDTAGIRPTSEIIETEGIKRTYFLLENAFYKILIINPFEMDTQELKIILQDNFDLILVSHCDIKGAYYQYNKLNINLNKKIIFTSFLNKPLELIDNSNGSIEPVDSCASIEPINSNGPIEPVNSSGPIEPQQLIDNTKINSFISEQIDKKYEDLIKDDPILIDRQRQLIQSSYNKYLKLKDLLPHSQDIAIALSELSLLENEIIQLIGVVSSDDVLDSIFSNFCIGK